jgi:hypothetical protein
MRIYLADLAHDFSVDDRSLTIPLNVGYVSAYANAIHGDAVDISLFKKPELLLAAVTRQAPDMVGLANYGWNENLNLQIGRHLRKSLPGALLVAGGPNIDPDPVRRLDFLKKHNYLDFLVVGGGEEPFEELIRWWAGSTRHFGDLPQNIVYQDGDSSFQTPVRELTKVIENIPSPYLNGHLDEFLSAGMVPLLETNRGCPFQCTFCAWGSASQNLVRQLSLENALNEIAYIGDLSTATNWIVCDANFGMLKRDTQIATAIRAVKDEKGTPNKCHAWLAKNVTERNLEIGTILGDMVVPCMAVQSLDDEVLKNIKRGNISLETYREYQAKFHAAGSRTYSDLVVPLPAETLETHLDALRCLFDVDVDCIQNHNVRMLAGAELSSPDTRDRYGYKTKYRLIHGDAGRYVTPDGEILEIFEYEESVRGTETISEADMFYLRKLHFLVDFCWNIDVYKPLLKVLKHYGVNPVEIFDELITSVQSLSDFWERFDAASDGEWFESEGEIQSHFAQVQNFDRLISGEYEKLNTQFSVIALHEYKEAFDEAFLEIVRRHDATDGFGEPAWEMTCSLFPPLGAVQVDRTLKLPAGLVQLARNTSSDFVPIPEPLSLDLVESEGRRKLQSVIGSATTLSKVLNVQGIFLRDLSCSISSSVPSPVSQSIAVGYRA